MLWLIKIGQHLMRRGFKGKQFAMRGAIAFGDCVHDKNGGAIIGAPWAYSSGLEKTQQWSGLAIHSTAEQLIDEKLKSSGLIANVNIPLKDENGKTIQKQGWVVDWRSTDITELDIQQTFSKLGEASDKDREKLQNTLNFYNLKQ